MYVIQICDMCQWSRTRTNNVRFRGHSLQCGIEVDFGVSDLTHCEPRDTAASPRRTNNVDRALLYHMSVISHA